MTKTKVKTMNKFLKTAIIALAAISMTACSSFRDNEEFIMVGKVKKIEIAKVTQKPSFFELAVGATIGGVIGHQFGGGSGKDWATGVGAVAGGFATDAALTKKYLQARITFYFPDTREERVFLTKNIPAVQDLQKNALVVYYKKDGEVWFDYDGMYSEARHKAFQEQINRGQIHY